jgi:hypothetical protein
VFLDRLSLKRNKAFVFIDKTAKMRFFTKLQGHFVELTILDFGFTYWLLAIGYLLAIAFNRGAVG